MAKSTPKSAVHLLVAEWVQRQPDECAVRDASTHQEITFAQLWQKSGYVAQRLQDRGVGRGDFVGLAMGRSIELIAAVLGILGAGAPYLPLDAHAPADRLAMLLAEADARVVVEAAAPAQPWPLPEGIDRLQIAAATEAHRAGESPQRNVGVSGKDPAYVAYTSG